jgi:hypothetical protein
MYALCPGVLATSLLKSGVSLSNLAVYRQGIASGARGLPPVPPFARHFRTAHERAARD